MVRNRELDRFILYFKGLGLKVTIYNRSNKNHDAFWTTDGTEMGLYFPPGMSKTELLFSGIHEGGHHLTFINDYKRKSPKKLETAVDMEDARKKGEIIPKKYRQALYDHEIRGLAWWDVIIRDINIKIPQWKIGLNKEMDIFPYEFYLKNGEWPSKKVRRESFKELKAKWKP